MTAPLHLVPKEPDIDDLSARLNIRIRRNQLMKECVKFVRECKVGHIQDRIRIASDASGIPRSLIEVEVGK